MCCKITIVRYNKTGNLEQRDGKHTEVLITKALNLLIAFNLVGIVVKVSECILWVCKWPIKFMRCNDYNLYFVTQSSCR